VLIGKLAGLMAGVLEGLRNVGETTSIKRLLI